MIRDGRSANDAPLCCHRDRCMRRRLLGLCSGAAQPLSVSESGLGSACKQRGIRTSCLDSSRCDQRCCPGCQAVVIPSEERSHHHPFGRSRRLGGGAYRFDGSISGNARVLDLSVRFRCLPLASRPLVCWLFNHAHDRLHWPLDRVGGPFRYPPNAALSMADLNVRNESGAVLGLTAETGPSVRQA